MMTFLNMLPSKKGISRNPTLEAIILGSPEPDYNNLRIKFGAYANVYIVTTNSTKQRILGSISLRPENEWGGHYFMLLATSKQLHVCIWKELSINKQVIKRVYDLDKNLK